MERDKFRTVTLGVTMIAIGIAPTVLFLLGGVPKTAFVSDVGGVTRRPVFDGLAVRLVLSGFGLFLAAMGVFIIKYGRPALTTGELY